MGKEAASGYKIIAVFHKRFIPFQREKKCWPRELSAEALDESSRSSTFLSYWKGIAAVLWAAWSNRSLLPAKVMPACAYGSNSRTHTMLALDPGRREESFLLWAAHSCASEERDDQRIVPLFLCLSCGNRRLKLQAPQERRKRKERSDRWSFSCFFRSTHFLDHIWNPWRPIRSDPSFFFA